MYFEKNYQIRILSDIKFNIFFKLKQGTSLINVSRFYSTQTRMLQHSKINPQFITNTRYKVNEMCFSDFMDPWFITGFADIILNKKKLVWALVVTMGLYLYLLIKTLIP